MSADDAELLRLYEAQKKRRDDRIAALEAALRDVLAYEIEKAKLNGLNDCTCMGHSRQTETAYETGRCPHQIARALAPEQDK